MVQLHLKARGNDHAVIWDDPGYYHPTSVRTGQRRAGAEWYKDDKI